MKMKCYCHINSNIFIVLRYTFELYMGTPTFKEYRFVPVSYSSSQRASNLKKHGFVAVSYFSSQSQLSEFLNRPYLNFQ